MGKVSASFLAVLSLLWYAVSGNEQHFVCKHIEDVFHESETTEVTPRFRARQGPPGKMGPQGVRGERGLPGNAGKPGNVDYNRINGTISEKVTHALKEMKSTIEELKTNCSDFLAEWEEMKPTVVELKRKRDSESNCIGQRGLFTSGKCYIVPRISSSQDKTYDEAVADCAKFGALVAEVHDRIEQKALFRFCNHENARWPVARPHVAWNEICIHDFHSTIQNWKGNQYESVPVAYWLPNS